MKTITRVFTRGDERFLVTGEFEFLNMPGTVEVQGNAERFLEEVLENYGIEEDWSMDGDQFGRAYMQNPMGWIVETTESGEWSMMEL